MDGSLEQFNIPGEHYITTLYDGWMDGSLEQFNIPGEHYITTLYDGWMDGSLEQFNIPGEHYITTLSALSEAALQDAPRHDIMTHRHFRFCFLEGPG
ncbi:hypothetical protein RRG08_014814 [Elysia crispata]|uniref:Uncharacterized protein n=1 Tax=Elysia crispata TaxID=231223 RepID=A0AAE0Z910_9GAST|nr:hypothetical protein RRG08_014814 [Elysia crispata]